MIFSHENFTSKLKKLKIASKKQFSDEIRKKISKRFYRLPVIPSYFAQVFSVFTVIVLPVKTVKIFQQNKVI
jgi:hypothetical protein